MHIYFLANLDSETYELTLEVEEIELPQDDQHRFDAEIVLNTLARMVDECREFVEGLRECDVEKRFGVEFYFENSTSPYRPIYELCLTRGSMTLPEVMDKFREIMYFANRAMEDVAHFVDPLPCGSQSVDWKSEGF